MSVSALRARFENLNQQGNGSSQPLPPTSSALGNVRIISAPEPFLRLPHDLHHIIYGYLPFKQCGEIETGLPAYAGCMKNWSEYSDHKTAVDRIGQLLGELNTCVSNSTHRLGNSVDQQLRQLNDIRNRMKNLKISAINNRQYAVLEVIAQSNPKSSYIPDVILDLTIAYFTGDWTIMDTRLAGFIHFIDIFRCYGDFWTKLVPTPYPGTPYPGSDSCELILTCLSQVKQHQHIRELLSCAERAKKWKLVEYLFFCCIQLRQEILDDVLPARMHPFAISVRSEMMDLLFNCAPECFQWMLRDWVLFTDPNSKGDYLSTWSSITRALDFWPPKLLEEAIRFTLEPTTPLPTTHCSSTPALRNALMHMFVTVCRLNQLHLARIILQIGNRHYYPTPSSFDDFRSSCLIEYIIKRLSNAPPDYQKLRCHELFEHQFFESCSPKNMQKIFGACQRTLQPEIFDWLRNTFEDSEKQKKASSSSAPRSSSSSTSSSSSSTSSPPPSTPPQGQPRRNVQALIQRFSQS